MGRAGLIPEQRLPRARSRLRVSAHGRAPPPARARRRRSRGAGGALEGACARNLRQCWQIDQIGRLVVGSTNLPMLDVVGVGTNSVDEVLQLPVEAGAVPAGGKVRVSDRRFLCGGQTATVMAACAALGLRCGYLGAFGSDEHGRLIRNALKSCGVDVRELDRLRCAEPRRGHPRRSAREPHRSLASQRAAEAAVRGTARRQRCRRRSCMSMTMILSWRCMPPPSRARRRHRHERSRARLGSGRAVDCVGHLSDLRAASAGVA